MLPHAVWLHFVVLHALPLLRKEDLGEVKKRVYKIINGEIDGN